MRSSLPNFLSQNNFKYDRISFEQGVDLGGARHVAAGAEGELFASADKARPDPTSDEMVAVMRALIEFRPTILDGHMQGNVQDGAAC